LTAARTAYKSGQLFNDVQQSQKLTMSWFWRLDASWSVLSQRQLWDTPAWRRQRGSRSV